MRFSTAISLSLITILSLVSCKQEMRPPIDGDENAKITAAASKTIIGNDDRQSSSKIGSPLETATNKVGQLITYNQIDDREFKMETCSATLIQKNYIITAAHCAFNLENGSLLVNQYFYPGIKKGNTSPHGKYRVAEVFLPKNFSPYGHHAEPSTDMAIMRLDPNEKRASAGAEVGYFGFWGKEEFVNSAALTMGYPSDKEASTQYFEKDCQVDGNPHDNRLELQCDVFSGQSGSPVLIHSNKYNNYYLQGVITAESSSINYGSRLSKERGKIITYILKGEFGSQSYKNENFLEQWYRLKHDSPNIVDIRIKNTCSTDLYLAYDYKNKNGEWLTAGYLKIKANQERLIFQTTNGIYYLRAVKDSSTTLTHNNSDIYLPSVNRDVPFQKYSTNKYGVFTHKFGCD